MEPVQCGGKGSVVTLVPMHDVSTARVLKLFLRRRPGRKKILQRKRSGRGKSFGSMTCPCTCRRERKSKAERRGGGECNEGGSREAQETMKVEPRKMNRSDKSRR